MGGSGSADCFWHGGVCYWLGNLRFVHEKSEVKHGDYSISAKHFFPFFFSSKLRTNTLKTMKVGSHFF